MLYYLFKWLHVLSALTAFGVNITYFFWFNRALRHPKSLSYTLKTVETLDKRIANPAYGIALLTGVAMIIYGGWPILQKPWLLTSIIIYVLIVVIGIALYTPTLKRQIKLAESEGGESENYLAAHRRGQILGTILTVMVLVILYMMVFKPDLWG